MKGAIIKTGAKVKAKQKCDVPNVHFRHCMISVSETVISWVHNMHFLVHSDC